MVGVLHAFALAREGGNVPLLLVDGPGALVSRGCCRLGLVSAVAKLGGRRDGQHDLGLAATGVAELAGHAAPVARKACGA